VLANRDVFVYDKKWSEGFLNNPIVIERLENLTDKSMTLLSWSLKISPKKITFNRRFSRLSMLTTKLFLQHLQDFILIAKCADNTPTSYNVTLTKLEQLQKNDPTKAMWYSIMIALSGFVIAFFLIIGLPFLLLLFISGKL
jgi:ABC-type phosphate/phosphonate transport system permease subunit